MQGGRYVTCKQTWGFAAYITSLVPVIGHSRAGICRRPTLSNEIWKLVATICENANLEGRCASIFGKYIRTVIPNNSLSSWKATAMHSIHRLCQHFKKYKAFAQNQEATTRNAESDEDVSEGTMEMPIPQAQGDGCCYDECEAS